MKQKLLYLWVMLLASVGAVAQTDVTSQYLVNAGFDDSSSWQTSNVATSGNANSQAVAGWTLVSSAAWSSSASFGYGSSGQINGAAVPSVDSNGSASGGALGISTGWSGVIKYTQAVTLPAGKYRISYKTYCATTEVRSLNYIGFEPTDGTPLYGLNNDFTPSAWKEGAIYLDLATATSGSITVGAGAYDTGSGNHAKFFIDYVKIEAYNPAESTMQGTSVTAGSWTGNTGTYGEQVEYYNGGALPTGDIMTNRTTVANGIYDAYVWFQAHRAGWSGVPSSSYGTGSTTAYAKCGETTFNANYVDNTSLASYEPKLYHFNDVNVTDGTLSVIVGNELAAANWLTAKIVAIYPMTTPTVGYGSANFPLPSTAVTAGYWYQIPVAVAGDYMLTPSASTTISYTQDGTALTSSTFSTTTGGVLTLAAGTLYVKSTAAVTLTLAANNYGYSVGEATIDRTYVQGGEMVTVTYADAATNDPNTNLTITTSDIRFNGSTITATATANGFTFTVPAITAGTDYTLTLPAGVARYGSHASSAAQTITLHTPAVFDGTYFLCNQDGKYLSRGSSWGTRAIVDDWGLPVEVTTDAQGVVNLKFVDSGVYLYATTDAAVWCDSNAPTNANAQWNATLSNGRYRLTNVSQGNVYLQLKADNADLFLENAQGSTIQDWVFELPAAHPAKMTALRTAVTALSSEVSGLSSNIDVEGNPTATAEEFQGDSYSAWKPIFSGTFTAYPGIYKFTIPAFHRMGNNDITLPLHAAGIESVPVYAYFGDKKVQLHSVYDATMTAADGCYTPDEVNYYPNTQGTALTAFQAGSYKNEIWLQVTEPTTIEYGIANQGVLSMAGRWTCYSESGIEIVRYYDPSTGTLSDGDDVTSLIVNPTIQSTNEGQIPAGWAGHTSSWRWTVGTGDTYMECWNGSAQDVSFDMYQTLSGLQEGVYELSADMFNSSNAEELAAQFTGGECGLYASTPSAHAFVGVTTDGDVLSPYTLYIYVKEGETLTLGVKNMATPTARWFGCDNFTLKYRTLESASSDLIASIPASQANSSLKSAMNSANMNLGNASTKTGDLFNALTSAIADVRVSAANYGHLLYALNTNDSRLAATPSTVQTEYASLISTYRTYYDNQTASGNCETEIHIVKAALAQALINQNESLTYLIVNNSFETGDATGWNVTYSDDTGVKTNGGATYGTDGGDGNYLFNTWATGYPAKQNIGYLPAGTYKLTGLVATDGGTVFLLFNDFASSGTTCTDKTTFLTAAITVTLDNVTEVTIGAAGGDGAAYTGNAYCWYKADNFQLSAQDEQSGGNEEEDDVMISSNSYYARGSQNIFGRFSVKGSSSAITEQGLCYSSTNKEPTVGDSKSTDYISYCGKIFKISDLTPATAYYVRPYATIDGSLYYGEVHKVYTLPAGGITYGIRASDNATYDANITNAISTWAEYWNKYTCISGYYCSAGFVDGTPTADCSYGGWIRFGSNTSYQQCGTAMHENLHGIGMGTTTEWSNLGSGKTWAGPRINEFIKFFENSDGATMYGDSQHAWCSNSNGGLSYTINGAHEDAYSDLQRTANSLLAQAYTEDGLRPTSGAYYFTPYYSIEQEDDDVFYIQNSSNGKYLVDNNGTLNAVAYASLDDAKTAGIGAWKLTFDPVTRWYHLTSIKHGNKLSHQNYAWGINKEDENLLIVKSINEGKYYINTPTTNGRNLLGNLTCGTSAPVDTSDANGQDWIFYREQAEEEVFYGDINKSGYVSLADLTALINILNGDTTNPNYDYKAANVNQDAGITAADIKALIHLLFPPIE